MVCKNCGYQLEDDAVFCGQCGARVVPDTPYAGNPNGQNYGPEYTGISPDYQRKNFDSLQSPPPAPRKSRAPLYIAIAAAAVLVIGAGTGFTVWYLSHSSEKTAQQDEAAAQEDSDALLSKDTEDTDEKGGDALDSDNNSEGTDSKINDSAKDQDGDTEPGSAAQNTAPFIIDPEADADYVSALDPSEYEFYASATDGFSFWYPTEFYNKVKYNTNPDTISYGTNIEEVIFSAKDGSQLTFQAIQRTDTLDIKSMSDRVYTTEFGRLTSPEMILNNVKDGSGKVIVTGWAKEHPGNTVYCLTRIEQDTIFQMTVLFPDYTDETDQLRKSYITECYYRMCGFSGADPWRTYEDFVKENG